MQRYEAAVAAGQLRVDPRQRQTMQLLEDLYQQLKAAKQGRSRNTFVPPPPPTPVPTPAPSSRGGLFGFAKKILSSTSSSSSVTPTAPSSSTPAPASSSSSPFHGIRGLYLHGGVGCGKTMLMNLFYDSLIPDSSTLQDSDVITRKRVRKHFHTFMLDIHRRLHAIRQSRPGGTQDPLVSIGADLVSSECEVLCLDEFQVTDVADAMILKTLFTALWNNGCVLVATSNRPPEELYKNGLNRPVFLPFIDALKQRCHVHAMEDGVDHRLLGSLAEGVFHHPISSETDAAMDDAFERLAKVAFASAGRSPNGPDALQPVPARIEVMMGRSMSIPRSTPQSIPQGVARFTFQELCESNVGAADYIALCASYRFLILEKVPILYFHERAKIRRFITLLDVAYENHVRVIIQADAPPAELFRPTPPEIDMELLDPVASGNNVAPEFEGVAGGVQSASRIAASTAQPTHASPTTSSSIPPATATTAATSSTHGAPKPSSPTASMPGAQYDEQFASSRAVSRLIEMSSQEYLEACAKHRDQKQQQQQQHRDATTSSNATQRQSNPNQSRPHARHHASASS